MIFLTAWSPRVLLLYALGAAFVVLGSVGLWASYPHIITAFIQELNPYLSPIFFLLGLAVCSGTYFTARQRSQRLHREAVLAVAKAKEVEAAETAAAAQLDEEAKRQQKLRPEAAFSQVGREGLCISLGPKLALDLLAKEKGDQVLERFNDVRREIARETGIVIPGINLRDDLYLEANAYSIFIRGELISKGVLTTNKLFALGNAKILGQLQGEETLEPVYGVAAKLIAIDDGEYARGIGAMTFDALSVLASHFGQAARDHLHKLFGRQEFAAHFDHIRSRAPALTTALDDIVQKAVIYKTYKLLLREYAWPYDHIMVLETILSELEKYKPYQRWLYNNNSWDRTVEDFTKALEVAENPRTLAEAVRKEIIPLQLKRKKKKTIAYLSLTEKFIKKVKMAWDNPLFSFAQISLSTEVFARIKKDAKSGMCIIVNPEDRGIVSDFFVYTRLSIPVYATDEISQDLKKNLYAVFDESEYTEYQAESILALPDFPL